MECFQLHLPLRPSSLPVSDGGRLVISGSRPPAWFPMIVQITGRLVQQQQQQQHHPSLSTISPPPTHLFPTLTFTLSPVLSAGNGLLSCLLVATGLREPDDERRTRVVTLKRHLVNNSGALRAGAAAAGGFRHGVRPQGDSRAPSQL